MTRHHYDLIVRGRRILADGLIRPAVVAVSDGVVVDVARPGAGDNAVAEVTVELLDDEVLLPGLVDTHVHVNEPGRTEWEGFDSATRAAAAGGVTTILDMPLNSIPPTVSATALEVKRLAAAGQCHVDVGFWGGAVPASLGSLRELHDAGVFGVKCFMLDSGVPEFLPLDGSQLVQALTELAAFDGLLLVHAEDAQTIESHATIQGPRYSEFLSSRPPSSERRAVQLVVDAARRTGARVHIVHVSSGDVLPVLERARAEGVRVSAETCPHYLTLTAEEVADGQTQFKCCPPIREEANRDELWRGLSAGVLDIVVSDHSPTTPDLKLLGRGDFGAAWGGISSLQLGLSVVWSEARRRGYDLRTVVGWMSERPAALMRVPRKGRIAVGFDADFAIFAPDQRFTVDAADLHHRHPISPYDGKTLTGAVRATYLRGVPVSGDDPRGQLVLPEPPGTGPTPGWRGGSADG
jgi:allantoinase